MASTVPSVPWADINALFADLEEMGLTNAPDAAHQASEGAQPESFMGMLAGGIDFLAVQADPCGVSPVLDAPRPHASAPSSHIDPQLALNPTTHQNTSHIHSSDNHARSTNALKASKEQVKEMADEARQEEGEAEDLQNKIQMLEDKLASYASADETIKSQKEQIERYQAGEKVGNKAVKQLEERIKYLDDKAASYASADGTIRTLKDEIERYKTGEANGNETLYNYQRRLHELQETLQEQRTVADGLRQKNEQQEMALRQRGSNYNDLQTTSDQQQMILEAKEEQAKTQEERIRQLSREVERHMASINMADDEITKLNKAAKERETREGRHRDERRDLKTKAASLETELESTIKELEAAREEIKALKVESREKGYAIQRLEESQGSYVKVYNETLTLQDSLRSQDEDMVAMKGDLQDLEDEIARLRKGRRAGSSRSESRDGGEREPVPGVGGYTTLEGIFEEDDEEEGVEGGEPAGPAGQTGGMEDSEDGLDGGDPAAPAEGTETRTGAEAVGGMDEDDDDLAGGEPAGPVEGTGTGTGPEVGGGMEEEEEGATGPAPVDPVVRIVERIVEVPAMVYCPWLWWKMPYQALMLILIGGKIPSVFAVFWTFVGCHIFALDWPLIKFFSRHVDLASLSPHPRRLLSPAKVLMLLLWHLVVYVCIGLVLWHLSGAMAERTMWLRANQLSRSTLVGLRETLRQSPNFGNPVVRFALRLAPSVTAFERVAGSLLPANRGVFG